MAVARCIQYNSVPNAPNTRAFRNENNIVKEGAYYVPNITKNAMFYRNYRLKTTRSVNAGSAGAAIELCAVEASVQARCRDKP